MGIVSPGIVLHGKGRTVRRETLDQYFLAGRLLRALEDPFPTVPVFGDEGVLPFIEILISFIRRMQLKTTGRMLGDLEEFVGELKSLDQASNLGLERARRLSQITHDLSPTLIAELGGRSAFVTTPKRFDVDRLLGKVGHLFGAGVFKVLPQLARYDLYEGGKCLAFERATASAFHVLRAMEGTLREFYLCLVKGAGIPDRRMWGDMIADLKDRKTIADTHEVLLDELDLIRRSYRNPTQHPQARYNMDRAQDLWSQCIPVINRMVEAMKSHKT